MSLREARIDDYWRHCFARVFPTRIDSFTFEGLFCLSQGGLTFSPGITAIIGGNGVGKSTLIAAIAELVSNADAVQMADWSAQTLGSKTTGTAFSNSEERHLSVSERPEGGRERLGALFDGETRWLDPSAFAHLCVKQIRGDTNFSDLLESATPIELDEGSLKEVSYLVGKTYTRFLIYEITDYAEMDRFPYFQVVTPDAEYGSEGMGRGELALCLSYWTLRDLPKHSILILDEPETHVSPRSQDHLMNLVAKYSDARGIWVITTTHSPTIIRRLPRENIRLIARGAGQTSITESPSQLQVAAILGGGVAYKGVLLVEDLAAMRFLIAMLEELAPDLLSQFEITSAGSDDQITRVLAAFPETEEWLTVVGVYDGGMEARINQRGFKWPCVFLPGASAPEVVLRTFLPEHQVTGELATELGKSSDEILVAMNAVEGIDHHEWIGEFATVLGLDAITTTRAFIHLWITRHPAEADEFVANLRSAFEKAHADGRQ